MGDFRGLVDLAGRGLGGSVVVASDESFAEKENLINPWRARFEAGSFGAKGQVYDGWETARRRPGADGELGNDWVIVRLGLGGVVRGVVIDTAWFKGNFPPFVRVEALAAAGYPSVEELQSAEWTEIVSRSPLTGDAEHEFEVGSSRRFTHVRLHMIPDGGIARLRVYGEVVPDPRLLEGMTVDLAALENGARVLDASDQFYSSPANMLAPGLARNQAEGWETARRRDDGNDWVIIRLAGEGVGRLLEVDTTHLKFNAPAAVSVYGTTDPGDEDGWFEVLPRTRLQPDQRHKFRLAGAREVTHLKVNIYPDGGLGRLRLYGELTADGQRALAGRWAATG